MPVTKSTLKTLINDIIREVIKQTKYEKDPDGKSEFCDLTVRIYAR